MTFLILFLLLMVAVKINHNIVIAEHNRSVREKNQRSFR